MRQTQNSQNTVRAAWRHTLVCLAAGLALSACGTTHLSTKVSGNINKLSARHTVAILPAQVQDEKQQEMADLFRQSLHANLKQSQFNLLEHYMVDAQLKRSGLTDTGEFWDMNPMRFGEVLGVDAVLLTRINKVEKSYMLLHSSIELNISARMVDTRSGEILWMAEQTESDYEGLAKIPTGLASAVIAPLYLVTNAVEMDRMTSNMVGKLTSLVKFPDQADNEGTFQEPVFAKTWNAQDEEKAEQVHWSQILDKDKQKAVANLRKNQDASRLSSIEQVPADAVLKETKPVSKRLPVKIIPAKTPEIKF